MDKRISRGCPSPGDTKCVYTLPFYLFSSRPKDVVRPAMPKTRRAPRGPVLCLALLAKLACHACLLRLNNYSVYCVSPRVWPSSSRFRHSRIPAARPCRHCGLIPPP